ncbi:hypothetical protein VNO78_24700 [Psophocarpus tetragonolobus]|uniref:Uncharacterized protein n=1 Tax=Psophocarpus tetragonolobus TaxID=3891 RepID=A0AAN9S5S5_PSOTE
MTESKLSFLNGWKLESTKNKRDYIYVILCGARSLHWNIVWLCVSLTRPCPLCRQRKLILLFDFYHLTLTIIGGNLNPNL